MTYDEGLDPDAPGLRVFRIPRIPFTGSVKVGPSFGKMLRDSLMVLWTAGLLLRRRYSVVHAHEEAIFWCMAFKPLFRYKLIYDMHSSPTEQLSNFKYAAFGPLIRIFDWIERSVVKNSSAVITICPALEDHVKAISGNVPQVMIENVANIVDPDSVPESDIATLKESYPELEGKRVVMYAGTFEAYQGIDLLVDCAQRVVSGREDVIFLMVGGKPEQVTYYKERARELGLSQSFLFTGIRPPEEVPAFIRLSDILVSPRTRGTNTPLKIYSYLQSAKAIVATDLYTHTQVLDRNVSVLADPDAEAFAEGIISVLDDAKLAESLGKRAKELFESAYTFQAYVLKTERAVQLAMG
ncbi:MAG: glycosyltransferase [Chloroflexi bacterium]|nr:glycosyltransferase [Chloroflexota bacterium]